MRRLAIIAVVLVLVLSLAVTGPFLWIYHNVHTPHAHSRADDFIRIEKGSTPKQIIAQLVDEGILTSYSAALIYFRFYGDPAKMQAGEYQFESPITPIQVLKELEAGEERTVKLTIPEGFTRFDIAKRIVEKFPQEPPITDAD